MGGELEEEALLDGGGAEVPLGREPVDAEEYCERGRGPWEPERQARREEETDQDPAELREVAEVLGCSLGTVAARRFTAIRKLQKRLSA
mgnify:CR=1 FL=1